MQDIDELTKKTFLFTEKLLDYFMRTRTFPVDSVRTVRHMAFEHIFTFLNKHHGEQAEQALDAIVASRRRTVSFQPEGYVISQKDVNDGLKAYSQNNEFKSFIQTLQWGKSGSWNADPDPKRARKALLAYLIKELDGSGGGSRSLSVELSSDPKYLDDKMVEHNHNLLSYHSKRMAHIIKSQEGSFSFEKTHQTTTKPPSENTSKETDVEFYRQVQLEINHIILEADDYLNLSLQVIQQAGQAPKRKTTP